MANSDANSFLDDPLKVTGALVGGAFLLSPLGRPILQGAARLALTGLGLYAAGSMVGKATDAFVDMAAPADEPVDETLPEEDE